MFYTGLFESRRSKLVGFVRMLGCYIGGGFVIMSSIPASTVIAIASVVSIVESSKCNPSCRSALVQVKQSSIALHPWFLTTSKMEPDCEPKPTACFLCRSHTRKRCPRCRTIICESCYIVWARDHVGRCGEPDPEPPRRAAGSEPEAEPGAEIWTGAMLSAAPAAMLLRQGWMR